MVAQVTHCRSMHCWMPLLQQRPSLSTSRSLPLLCKSNIRRLFAPTALLWTLTLSHLRTVSAANQHSRQSISTPSRKYSMSEDPQKLNDRLDELQAIIGNDVGNRGMDALIVQGDLVKACQLFASLPAKSQVTVLSGFPCCTDKVPPTETDGPPGAAAICQTALALHCNVVLVTDECNAAVFQAATEHLRDDTNFSLQTFPQKLSVDDQERFDRLKAATNLFIACERAGPGKDGHCYTMRAIDMTEKGLIAPLHDLVTDTNIPFIAIGDGGNELGMGKVCEKIVDNPKIHKGDVVGCIISATHLIAASVSNWGGYALAAGTALVKSRQQSGGGTVEDWVEKCVPTRQQEVELLERCVKKGCRDGVSGKVEATVDGLPLETSLQALDDLRAVVLKPL